jgi:NAD(P)-dependent dehydrogenase (short-subunit alcohol dehydrogenase family)
MKDPVVLATGTLTGIGRATALAFANEGGRIVASGRRDAEGHGHARPGWRLQRVTGTFSRISTNSRVAELADVVDMSSYQRDVQGSSMREVAGASKISVANARSGVHRGRLFLRKRLAMFAVESTTRQLASDEVAFTTLPDLLTL